jgi:hypothetical protein
MLASEIRIVTTAISRAELLGIAAGTFGDFVKAVVDLDRGIIAVGGELQADEEALLLNNGSTQENLWGINIYPELSGDDMIEFDSMINVRPREGNRSRTVEDPSKRGAIVKLVMTMVKSEER